LVTWNVNGLDDEALDERTEAAVFITILGATLADLHEGATPQEPPDVIVYQEVVERTYLAHLTPHLTAGGYTLVPKKAPGQATFEVTAVRAPYEIRSHEVVPLAKSVFDRHLNITRIHGPGGDMNVLTAHFDSGTTNGAIRTAQLRQVAAAMGARGVFAGDANLRKAEWIEVKPSLNITDAWEALDEPASTRSTWRRMTDGEAYKARFDRLFLTSNLKATSMAPLGAKTPKGFRVPISDHIGLRVEFS
jgi:endonuclease/exonuclease/phosphatase family metal-dependent hydrolase